LLQSVHTPLTGSNPVAEYVPLTHGVLEAIPVHVPELESHVKPPLLSQLQPMPLGRLVPSPLAVGQFVHGAMPVNDHVPF
jgi:hypothetical protein